MSTRGNLCDGLPRQPAVVAGGAVLLGRKNVEQVMWGASTLFGAWLGSPNFEFAIDCDRIAAYDFGGKVLGQSQRERSLAAGSRADDGDQQGILRSRSGLRATGHQRRPHG